MNAMIPRIERRRIITHIAQHDVGHDIGIDVLDGATGVLLDQVGETGRGLGVLGGAAAAVGVVARVAVAVDVHVCEGAGAVDEDCFARDGFLAVGPCCGVVRR